MYDCQNKLFVGKSDSSSVILLIIMANLFLLAGDSSVSLKGFILSPEVESLAQDQQTVVEDHQVSGQTDNNLVINHFLKMIL